MDKQRRLLVSFLLTMVMAYRAQPVMAQPPVLIPIIQVGASSSAKLQPNVMVEILPTPNTPEVWGKKLLLQIRALIAVITTSVKRVFSY